MFGKIPPLILPTNRYVRQNFFFMILPTKSFDLAYKPLCAFWLQTFMSGINFLDHGDNISAYLDPITLIIYNHPGMEMPCDTHRFITLKLNGRIIRVDQVTFQTCPAGIQTKLCFFDKGTFSKK